MTAEGRRATVLVMLPVVVLLAAVAFALAQDTDAGEPSTPETSSTRPSFGEALGEGIFGDAAQVGFEPDALGGIFSIPKCLGAVTQLAVVTGDLRHTVWSLRSVDAMGVAVREIRLGTMPDGFVVEELVDSRLSGALFVLVDGKDHRGAVYLESSTASVPPGDCA